MSRHWRDPGHRQRHQRRRHEAADAARLGPAPVDFAVNANLAENPFGQRTVDRHHSPCLIADPPHGHRGADEEMRRVDPRAAMSIGMNEARMREAPRCKADLLFKDRSEEHTSELQSLMRISYAVFC